MNESIDRVLSLTTTNRAVMALFYATTPTTTLTTAVTTTTTIADPASTVLRAPQSLTPEEINVILNSYGSPATGTGQSFYDLGLKYDIDAAYALAFFIHESGAGTAESWAGQKDGTTTHNIGNIICAGYTTCLGRFRDYPDWATGIEDWYVLIDTEYIKGRGFTTVDEVIPVYAPAFENDVGTYKNVIAATVAGWRTTKAATPTVDDSEPTACPVPPGRVRITQGYGVGTHAPAATWGAVDLAVGDAETSRGQPILATHAGYVIATPNSYPAGNHVWVTGLSWKTGYSHLAIITVETGMYVQKGDHIGTMGDSGMAFGPHLDYQVWHNGVNQEPNVAACFP